MASCNSRCLFPLHRQLCTMRCQLPLGHGGVCCCFANADDQYAAPIGSAEPADDNDKQCNDWSSADDLIGIFRAAGVEASKAAKACTTLKIRSPSALAKLKSSEAALVDINDDDGGAVGDDDGIDHGDDYCS